MKITNPTINILSSYQLNLLVKELEDFDLNSI